MLSDSQRPVWAFFSQSSLLRARAAIGRSIAVDLDDDGRPEVVDATRIGLSAYDTIHNTTTRVWRFGYPAVDVWAGDIDGDGRPELLPSLEGSPGVYVVDDVDDEFKVAWTKPVEGEMYLAQGGDVDGDGQAEVVVLNNSWGLFLLESDGSQVWGTESLSAENGFPYWIVRLI